MSDQTEDSMLEELLEGLFKFYGSEDKDINLRICNVWREVDSQISNSIGASVNYIKRVMHKHKLNKEDGISDSVFLFALSIVHTMNSIKNNPEGQRHHLDMMEKAIQAAKGIYCKDD